MSDEPKQEQNYLPLILVGVVLFFVLRQPREGGGQSDTGRIETVVKSTLPSIRSAYREAFLEAAKRIEAGEIKNQEAWTRYIADNAGAKQREALDKVYKAIDELDLPASFEGKEKEIAEINRKIGGSW
jgi:hypothetical protein